MCVYIYIYILHIVIFACVSYLLYILVCDSVCVCVSLWPSFSVGFLDQTWSICPYPTSSFSSCKKPLPRCSERTSKRTIRCIVLLVGFAIAVAPSQSLGSHAFHLKSQWSYDISYSPVWQSIQCIPPYIYIYIIYIYIILSDLSVYLSATPISLARMRAAASVSA